MLDHFNKKRVALFFVVILLVLWIQINVNGYFHPVGPVAVIDLSKISGADDTVRGYPYKVTSSHDSGEVIVIDCPDLRLWLYPDSLGNIFVHHYVKISFNLTTLRQERIEPYTVTIDPSKDISGLRMVVNPAEAIYIDSEADYRSPFRLTSELIGTPFVRLGVGGDLSGGFLILERSQIGIARLVLHFGNRTQTISWRIVLNANSLYNGDPEHFRIAPNGQYATLLEERTGMLYIFKGPFLGACQKVR